MWAALTFLCYLKECTVVLFVSSYLQPAAVHSSDADRRNITSNLLTANSHTLQCVEQHKATFCDTIQLQNKMLTLNWQTYINC